MFTSAIRCIRRGLMSESKGKQFAPAAARNAPHIVQTIKEVLAERELCGKVFKTALEIASGSGQHIAQVAGAFPNIQFQPSEYNKDCFTSIEAYIKESGLTNIKSPIIVDASNPSEWKIQGGSIDFILNINMIHISPIDACHGLFKGSGKILSNGGILCMYGPFKFHGVISPESNVNFDQSLRNRCNEWGLRDVDDLKVFASAVGLELTKVVEMPANNHILLFIKS